MRIAVAVCVAVAIVLVASACGSKSSSSTTSTSSQSSAEQWASQVCTAVVTWKQNVISAANSVKQNPTKDQISLAIEHARDWTNTLVKALQSLGPPETSGGTEAKATLKTLSTQLKDGAAKINKTADQMSGAQGSVEAVSVISSTLITMRDQVKAAGQKLKSLPTGELQQAFKTSASCKDLAASGSAT